MASRQATLKIPSPVYTQTDERVAGTTFTSASSDTQWYPPALIGAPNLAAMVVHDSAKYVIAAKDLLHQLDPDDYALYLRDFYQSGLERFGTDWSYADLVTVVLGLADILQPENYLEIGVRRGRSVCAVAKMAPDCRLTMFDMWIKNYAGMENPGPELVASELKKVGHRGSSEFIDGNSHETVPAYFTRHPDAMFDLITVDGDHTTDGAAQDLCDVLPHLTIGGAIVFDDICHPELDGLRQVWQQLVEEDLRFSSWNFAEVGYGVGFAVRKW